MSTETLVVTLASLELLPYLNEAGKINPELTKKIGVYAIFNQEQELMYVGYSRDVYLSLKQHLVRQPQSCFWLKFQTIARPSRTLLEEIRQAWITENVVVPLGNQSDNTSWTQPIDTKPMMSDRERSEYDASAQPQQIKLLKQVARRVQAEIEAQLQQRCFTGEIRFNPKLKEQGLLDLK